jgi:hypothetical protein
MLKSARDGQPTVDLLTVARGYSLRELERRAQNSATIGSD